MTKFPPNFHEYNNHARQPGYKESVVSPSSATPDKIKPGDELPFNVILSPTTRSIKREKERALTVFPVYEGRRIATREISPDAIACAANYPAIPREFTGIPTRRAGERRAREKSLKPRFNYALLGKYRGEDSTDME